MQAQEGRRKRWRVDRGVRGRKQGKDDSHRHRRANTGVVGRILIKKTAHRYGRANSTILEKCYRTAGEKIDLWQ